MVASLIDHGRARRSGLLEFVKQPKILGRMIPLAKTLI